MLELKDLTKIYKPKKGVPVEALKGVSLSFEEKGLVFVLGRSGSGKSTLLNVVGGLDFADSGEIIIDGRSTKDFSAADYDAYRNTYIGFIFQDYNVLDDFTVGENIMLALELQNQKADKERLNEILKEVDLVEYADRKPNELSGGQKQRVAIARALVKNPQIIMADEPTGALDEETGKQVLDTLKKMSKDKLVIVVSHDREFAEEYADRIIRLADGKVKADTAADGDGAKPIEKQAEEVKEKATLSRSRLPYRYALKMGASGVISKPFRLIITVFLCMLSFAAFGIVDTANAFNAKKVALNAYLNSDCEASVFTAYVPSYYYDLMADTHGASEKDIERLKEKTGMDYVGVTYLDDKEGFRLSFLSEESLIGNNNSQYYNKTIYGYYPASEEFFAAMGFGLIGELPKDDRDIVITKYTFEQINLGGMTLYTYFNEEGTRPDMYTTNVLPDTTRTAQSLVEQELYLQMDGEYWKIVGVLDTHEDKSGKYESLKPSESKFLLSQTLLKSECAEYFRFGYHSIGYISQDKYEAIVKSHSADLEGWDAFGAPVNGRISVRQGKDDVRFWGISSDRDLDRVKEITWLDGNERATLQDNEYVIGLNAALSLLQDDFRIESETYYTHSKTYFDGIISFDTMAFGDLYNSFVAYSPHEALFIACFEEAESISLNELQLFKEYVIDRINSIPYIEDFYTTNDAYVLRLLYNQLNISNKIRFDAEDLVEDVTMLEEKHWRLLYAGYLLSSSDWNTSIPIDGTFYGEWFHFHMSSGYKSNLTGRRTGEALSRIDTLAVYVKAKLNYLQLQDVVKYDIYYASDVFDYFYKPREEDSVIVGIYVPQDDFPEGALVDSFVFNNTMYDKVKNVEITAFSFVIAPMPTDRAQLQKLVDVHFEQGDRELKMHDEVTLRINLVQTPIENVKWTLFFVGFGLAIFSIIMIGNYIGTSIYNKKREVGILRALGAKTGDVFAIFVTESIIIALITAVFSIVVSIFACIGVNAMIKSKTQVDLTLLNFGIRQVAIMILINVAIAVFASLIPIYRLSKKKPIDCIRDR